VANIPERNPPQTKMRTLANWGLLANKNKLILIIPPTEDTARANLDEVFSTHHP